MALTTRSTGERIFDGANVAFMVLFSLVMIYPFVYVLNLSLSDAKLAMQGGGFLLPAGLSWKNYETVLTSRSIWTGYQNTIFVTIVGTTAMVTACAITAYPLSKKSLPGNTLITFFVVFTMLFNGGLIPTFLIVRSVGLLNTRLALFLPILVSGFNVVIMRNFFANIPDEIEDSAKMDGANDFTIFGRIVVPLSKPVLATITLWVAVQLWNDFFSCLIYIQDQAKFVVQMVLRRIVMSAQPDEMLEFDADAGAITPETVKAASIMVVTLPILFVYPFLQKYFVKGVMVGSLKG
jgi:putative aldouronate transport system permease protein